MSGFLFNGGALTVKGTLTNLTNLGTTASDTGRAVNISGSSGSIAVGADYVLGNLGGSNALNLSGGADGTDSATFTVGSSSNSYSLGLTGVGPGLSPYGVQSVLNDPRIQLYNADENVVARNDNWGTPDPVFTGQRIAPAEEITTTNQIVGAFELDSASADSALVLTLAPGTYAVRLDATTPGQSGNALIEIYEIPEVTE